MPYKQSPASFIKHKSNAVGYMSEGSVAHMHGDPDTPHEDTNNETLVSSKTTKSRETTPEGIKGTRLTTESKFKTPGDTVKRTAEGDKAYAALSQEQRDMQDAKFKAKKRSESQTRFTPDAIKIPTTGVRSIKQEIEAPKPTAKDFTKKKKVMPKFEFSMASKSGKTLINKKFRSIDLSSKNSNMKNAGKNPCKSCN